MEKKKTLSAPILFLIIVLILCFVAIIILSIIFAPKQNDQSGSLPDGTEQTPVDDNPNKNPGDDDPNKTSGDDEDASSLEFTLNEAKTAYTVTGIGTFTGTNLIVPATHQEASDTEALPVTAIGKDAFKDCTNVTSVVIPDSVVKIGSRPFDGCTQLKSMKIGSGMSEGYGVKTAHEWQDSIEGEAFAFGVCPALTDLEISPDNENYYAEGVCIIEKATKILVVGFENSVIPNDVTAIGEYAFLRQTGLQTIEIPNSVKAIGDQAFQSSGLESITIPDSVTFIGIQAFCRTKLSSISIPGSVTSLGTFAFMECENLTTVSFSNGFSTITEAFSDCKKLEKVIIPVSVTKIKSSAFGTVAVSNGVKQSPLTIIFKYTGSSDEWDHIEKEKFWDSAIGRYSVDCTDTTLEIDCSTVTF